MNCRRKIITRVIVFLLLGAIVNVAVAWGCVLSIARSDYGAKLVEAEMPWLASIPDDWSSPASQRFFHRFGSTEVLASGTRIEQNWHSWNQQRILQSGLPLRALYMHRNRVLMAQFNYGEPWEHPPLDWKEGIRIPEWSPLKTSRFKVLPAEPLWPGFAINTIFYAAILWLLFFAPDKVRRTIRLKRGLCPACAYPIGTSPVCTECGKPVGNRVR